MPRSRHVPMDDRPELTDEIVGEVLIPYDYDDVDIRDAIVDVLNAMDVSFVDRTTCKRAPVVDDGRWQPLNDRTFAEMMARGFAMIEGK